MELSEALRKYFKGDWTNDEKNSIQEIKKPLIREYMEKEKASFGMRRFSERDIETVINDPKSEKGRALIEKYDQTRKVNPLCNILSYIDETTAINYIHSMLPESRLEDFYSERHLKLKREGLELTLMLQFSEIGLGINDGPYKLSKSFNLTVEEIDFDKIQQTFPGNLVLALKEDVEIAQFSPGKYEEAFEEALSKIKNNVRIEHLVFFPLGDNVESRLINKNGLFICGKKYTEQLDELLTLLKI